MIVSHILFKGCLMEKKEKIIHAAIEVFREKGIEKTKISDIVRVAGIAQGTFYLYFPSKLSVMPHIADVMIKKTVAEMTQNVQRDAPLQLQLEQVVATVFKLAKEYSDVYALMYAGLTQTEHIIEWEDIYAPFYQWMSDFLNQAKASGQIRDSVNNERTAKIVIGLIESTAEQIYLYDNVNEEKIQLQKKELITFLQYGLGNINEV